MFFLSTVLAHACSSITTWYLQRNGFSPSIDSHSSTCSTATTTTPALPVLRHLRPEFAAQLSLGTSRNSTPAVSPREDQRPPRVEQQLSVESLTESLSDLQPAAPEVVLPLAPTPVPVPAAIKHQEKDGLYFLDLLKREIARINDLVAVVEDELTAAVEGDVPLPEEALGKLRAASGQARLFVRQKLQQFEGLCQKNISQEPGEQFPTTNEDLAGFWDMVKLQIDQIDKLYSEIERHRKAGWTKESLEAADEVDASTSRTIQSQASTKRRQGVATAGGPASSTTTQAANTKAAAARKARDEARRKMMEERRRALKESQQTHHLANNSSVEIFVTVQENGK